MKLAAFLLALPLLGQSIPFPGPGTAHSTGGGTNTDTFMAPDGTALATHNPNWIDMPRASGDVASCVIESNEARTVGAFAVCAAMYSISSSDASQIIIEPYSDAVVGKRVCVRAGVAAGADKTGYCAVFGSAAAGNWTTVDIIKDGAFVTSLFPLVADQTTSHTLKITASGTSTVTITGIVDGSTIGTVDDSSTPDGTGKPGFLMIGNGDAAVTGMGTWTDAP